MKFTMSFELILLLDYLTRKVLWLIDKHLFLLLWQMIFSVLKDTCTVGRYCYCSLVIPTNSAQFEDFQKS